MKSALEVLKIREEKRQQRIKDNQEQINKELLSFEKSLNKYESNIEDNKPYITVDTIIKTEEVKSLLKQNGYYIDKISNDIEVNTTRVYLDKFSLINSHYADLKIKDIHEQYTSKEEIENKAYEELTKSFEKYESHNKIKAEDWIGALIYLGQLQKEYCSKR